MSEPHHEVEERQAYLADERAESGVFAISELGCQMAGSATLTTPHSHSRSATQLIKFDEHLSQLVANVSHDLLTPLTRIRLRVETASGFCGQQKIIDDIDEMEGLVRDGLAHSTGSRGGAEPMLKVDVASFVSRLAHDYQDTGQSVRTRAIHSGLIETRPRALRRILTNLVDNALKFSGAAEIQTNIHSERMMVIAVLDRGPGIPSTHLLAAFERYCRVGSETRRPEGLGLGLAIARELATGLSSTLVLRNRKGGGLAAELTIPLRETRS